MNERAGVVFSIPAQNQPVPGCTVSKLVYQENGFYLSWFSLAAGTSISAESYDYPRLLRIEEGSAEVFTTSGERWCIHAGEAISSPLGVPVGIETADGCVYAELSLRKESGMNPVLKDGAVFSLKDLIPYQEGKIVNMDLISDEKLKYVVMSFDAGTGLAEHAAPGEALVFALDGKGVIGYEGAEHPIQEGECFKFAKNGKHWVKADGRFKMALLLTLD
jgi:quercetin dioxygenase-like cupin family protein